MYVCFAHVLLMLRMITNGLHYPKCLESSQILSKIRKVVN